MEKPAPTLYPVHELIVRRWSPYWFDPRPILRADLLSLLEAARWAPSSYNEQPWRFLFAERSDPVAHTQMVECLIEGNRTWAREAPVLMLALTCRLFARDGSENAACEHDLGQAAAFLSLEAAARGLAVHQMSGIEHDRIRQTYQIPDDVTPVTALAIGYSAPLESVPDRYRDRQARDRERSPIESFVFAGQWGSPAAFFDD